MPKARAPKGKPSKRLSSRKKAGAISAEMNVMEIIALHPGAADVLAAYGLHCFQCAFNTLDSLDAGAKTHGLTDTDVENMVNDLEELMKTAPTRPAVLTLTESGAKALLDIAKQEGKNSCLLRVGSDDTGGFCLEFAELKIADDHEFVNPAVKGVALIAAPAILQRIGGATVDFREGRFKLDIGTKGSCECEGKGCTCKSDQWSAATTKLITDR